MFLMVIRQISIVCNLHLQVFFSTVDYLYISSPLSLYIGILKNKLTLKNVVLNPFLVGVVHQSKLFKFFAREDTIFLIFR